MPRLFAHGPLRFDLCANGAGTRADRGRGPHSHPSKIKHQARPRTATISSRHRKVCQRIGSSPPGSCASNDVTISLKLQLEHRWGGMVDMAEWGSLHSRSSAFISSTAHSASRPDCSVDSQRGWRCSIGLAVCCFSLSRQFSRIYRTIDLASHRAKDRGVSRRRIARYQPRFSQSKARQFFANLHSQPRQQFRGDESTSLRGDHRPALRHRFPATLAFSAFRIRRSARVWSEQSPAVRRLCDDVFQHLPACGPKEGPAAGARARLRVMALCIRGVSTILLRRL